MRSELGGTVSVFVFLFLLFFIPALFEPLAHTDTEKTNLIQVDHSNYSTSSYGMLTANEAIWNQTFGGAGVDICYSLVEVEAGGFALAGMTNSFNDEWKTWLIRIASNGQHLWDKTYNFSLGYNSRTFVECSDGGFLFAGEIHKNSTNYTALLKTNLSGTLQWNKTYGVNRWPGRIAVVRCNSGGYAFLSTIQIGPSEYLWLVRIDEDGTPLWNQTYNAGESVYASSMLEVSNGDFLLVSLKEPSKDVWIMRTNSTGFTEWDLTYRTFGVPQECWSVLELKGGLFDGNFVIAGNIFGYSSTGNYDKPCYLWLLMVSGDGNKWWNRSFGFGNDDYGVSLVKVSSGGYAMIGSTSSFGNGKSDMWLVRTEEGGWHRWQRTFGGSENDWGVAMVEASDGGFVIGGFTESYGVNQSDVWLVRAADLPLWWVTKPQDIVIDLGMGLSYDLDAGSSLGIDLWWVNDTTNFAVDREGVITNTSLLNVGEYGVQINVNDSQNNILSETFTVTVLLGSLPPPQPLNVIQIFILFVILDVVGVVLLVLFLRFRRYQFK